MVCSREEGPAAWKGLVAGSGLVAGRAGSRGQGAGQAHPLTWVLALADTDGVSARTPTSPPHGTWGVQMCGCEPEAVHRSGEVCAPGAFAGLDDAALSARARAGTYVACVCALVHLLHVYPCTRDAHLGTCVC